MEELLNSKSCDAKIEELATRKNELVDKVAEKRTAFETSDVETRDGLLNEIEEMTKECDSIDAQIKELEEKRDAFKKQEERMSMTKSLEKTTIEKRENQVANQEDIYDTAEYRSAYVDAIRNNDSTKLKAYIEERANGASVSTKLDNVPIPTIMQGYVETAWEKFGKFSTLVAETFEPAILKIPVEKSADGAVWHDENGDPVAQETITLGQVVLQPKMIKKWIGLTDELMAMSPTEFLRYIADELVYRVVKALDDAIINRTDAKGEGVIGVVGNANTTKVSKALDFNCINNAVAELLSFDNVVVAMNPKTFFNNFMGLKDSSGKPIFTIVTMNDGKPAYYISGNRVEFTNAIKSYDDCSASECYAVVGDFARGYRCNYPKGKDVLTLVDPYTLSTEDIVRMIGKLYVAGNVVKLKHFAELDKPSA